MIGFPLHTCSALNLSIRAWQYKFNSCTKTLCWILESLNLYKDRKMSPLVCRVGSCIRCFLRAPELGSWVELDLGICEIDYDGQLQRRGLFTTFEFGYHTSSYSNRSKQKTLGSHRQRGQKTPKHSWKLCHLLRLSSFILPSEWISRRMRAQISMT